MKRIHFLVLALMMLLPLQFAACGGGGGGGPQSLTLQDLEGTWYGVGGTSSIFEWTVDGSGNVTEVKVNSVTLLFTGVMMQNDDNSFLYSVNDGSSGLLHGGMFVDDTGTYTIWWDELSEIAVLEKGATSLPSYAATDVVGSWSGFAYADSGGGLGKESPINVTTTTGAGNYPFTGTNEDDDPFSGSFNSWSAPSLPGWAGSITATPGDLEFISTMSPDKMFLGMVGYHGSSVIWPDDYIFILMTRN